MIEHKTANIFLTDRGFVWFKYKNDSYITLEDSHEYIKIINEICGGVKRCFILDSRGVFVTSSPEHRQFMGANPEALKWRKADAILIDQLPNRILSNYYKNFFSKNHPIQIFNDEETAIQWLSTF